MHLVEFHLTDRGVSCNRGTPRVLTTGDWALFDDFAQRYHNLVDSRAEAGELRKLGAEIAGWLDRHDHWLSGLRDTAAAPVIATFHVRAQPTEDDRRFLEVPWELAARDDQFLAEDPTIRWTPLRRLGDPQAPLVPEHKYKLGVMFVAASPYGQHVLDFEAEETAILRATRDTDMDLAVEDDGNLDAIRIAWNRAETLDVLHLSCHGIGGKDAFLALEDPDGDMAKVGLTDFAAKFVIALPRVLFLSACHSGENAVQVNSLAMGLVRAGFPAVLGWADAVADTDASRFAAAFYAEAAQTGATAVTAWASARYELMRDGRPPSHWHLARLFLGPKGGGRLAGGDDLRVGADHDAGHKDIVEARGGHRIEVASRYDFVGRRREIREIRHEFRRPDFAGVLIHGPGRQGKSSLAARIMDRLPQLERVVLFRACDGRSILNGIREKISGAETLCKGWLDREEEDPVALRRTLADLLKGPCGGGGKPILLVLDDFEALLDLPDGDDLARVKRDVAAPLAAVIRAFDDSRRGPSRLLITCRYDFAFVHEGRDLGAKLKKVPLPPMGEADVLKHARRKLIVPVGDNVSAAIRAARGNTGIRDMLFQALAADQEAGVAAVASVENHFTSDATIADEAIREAVEGLIIDQLLKPLTAGEMALLQASTLFQLPLPLPVWRDHAARASIGPCDRLLAFGLWDQFPDLVRRSQKAAAINEIVRSKLRDVPE